MKPTKTNKKIKVHFPGIKAHAWEHPADRVALRTLQSVPGLDTAIRPVFGATTEKSLRLLMLASAVRVNQKQFPRVYEALIECCQILDIEKVPELYVAQSPILNAGAVGMDDPFITLNSAMVDTLSDEELMSVIGHELGHIKSGHVLYKTLLILLIQFSTVVSSIPLTGAVLSGIIAALREWDRKSELSADRAGLLVVQDAEVSIHLLMKMAGGAQLKEMDLSEFIKQAEEYHDSNSVSESIYKMLNLLNKTHPFPVIRLLELLNWVKSGEYEEILRGFYNKEPRSFADDAKAAASSYSKDFKENFQPIADDLKDKAEKTKDFLDNFFKKK